MRERVKRFIQREHLLADGEPVLVAVSGGVDSMVLLHVLMDLGHPCTVAHVDHQLRGPESNADRAFVQAHCGEHAIPFMARAVAPKELAGESGRSLQMAARELRLQALREMAAEAGLSHIALAHHADDAVETLFMNLMRGTGLRGFAAIPAISGPFIRPLLEVERATIEAHAREHGVAFREDPSNRDPKYLRNRVRHELLPLIQQLRPGADAAMRRSLPLLREIVAIAHARLLQEVGEGLVVGKSFPLEAVRGSTHPRLLLARLLDRLQLHPDVIDSLLVAVEEERHGFRLHVGDHELLLERDHIAIIPSAPLAGARTITEDEAMNMHGPLTFQRCGAANVHLEQGPDVAWFDAGQLAFPLTLRPWQPGDRMRPIGLGGSKLVSDILTDARVSHAHRPHARVLLSGDRILWLVGFSLAEGTVASPSTREVWRVEQVDRSI